MENPKSFIKTPVFVSLFFLAIVYIFHFNKSLFYAINSTSRYIGIVWAHITLFGDGLLVAILLLPFLRKHHNVVWAMLWTAIIFNIILYSLKAGLNVPRPPLVLPTNTFFIIGPELHHYSFPSGHTTTAAALTGVLAIRFKNTWCQWAIFISAVLVGLSRIGVGVHWPADVLAGLALGWTSAWIGWKISVKIRIGTEFVFQVIIGFLLIAAVCYWLIGYKTHFPQTNWLRYALGSILLVWGILDYYWIIRSRFQARYGEAKV